VDGGESQEEGAHDDFVLDSSMMSESGGSDDAYDPLGPSKRKGKRVRGRKRKNTTNHSWDGDKSRGKKSKTASFWSG
jgi:hypothetical protein